MVLTLPPETDRRRTRITVGTWTEETLFQDTDAFFNALCESFHKAEKTIHIETYIFDRDHTGKKLLDCMQAAADRGVEVKMLLDGVGSSAWTYGEALAFKKVGIDVRFFHPLAWQKSAGKVWQSLTLQKIILGFSKLNQRNHRKVYLIDEKVAYTGSANVTDRHLRSQVGDRAWRDTGIRLQGDGVAEFHLAFLEAWSFHIDYYGKKHPLRKFAHLLKVARVNWTKEYRKIYYETLIDQVQRAKSEIWITNPYFVPDRKLMRALEHAARAKVDVQIIFPFQSDFFGVKLAMEGLYSRLLQAGVQIFEYLPSMMHAKVLILDKWVTVGSSNLNHRSLFNDLEADAVVGHPKNIEALRTQFQIDKKQCRKIEREFWKRRPFWKKVLEKFFFIFRTFL